MKIISPLIAIVTVGIHLLIAVTIKILDSFGGIALMVLLTTAVGFYFWKSSYNIRKSKIGLGLFSGGLISIMILTAFMFYLAAKWPK